MRALASAATAAAITVAELVSSPTAAADKYDFIILLDNKGVYYESISDMIDIGKAICHAIRNGGSLLAINDVLDSNGYNSDYERGTIVTSAAAAMCPDIWPTLNAQVAALEAPPPPLNDPPPVNSGSSGFA